MPGRAFTIHSVSSGGRSIEPPCVRPAPPTPSSDAAITSRDTNGCVARSETSSSSIDDQRTLELPRLAEIGFAEQVPRQRQHAALAILVGRDRVEDGGEPIGCAAVERQRRREQLRDLRIVERRGDAADDARSDRRRIVGRLHDLHHDVRIEPCVAPPPRGSFITVGTRSGDITDTMPVRWRKAASTRRGLQR